MNEQTIFTAALERQPGERSAFLDEVCGADQGLRQRVEKLLRLHADAGSFLDSPAADSSPTLNQAGSEEPGTIIGPYKLLQQIGEGGMGTVFMAEQTHPVQRKVALKLIKPGMDSRQVIARFDAERQALAMMDHVNIARVLDAGTTGEKGVGNLLCEAPDGPFRQKVPDPFSPSAEAPRRHKHADGYRLNELGRAARTAAAESLQTQWDRKILGASAAMDKDERVYDTQITRAWLDASATSLAAVLASLAQQQPSPWAAEQAALASAELDRTLEVDEAAMTGAVDLANADYDAAIGRLGAVLELKPKPPTTQQK